MKTIKPSSRKTLTIGSDFFNLLWEESWTYIKTVVDVVREPILILDKDLRVMAANEPFYQIFKVAQVDTAGKIIYQLGNGQWDIPDLRRLLEDILPKNTFFKGFQVSHTFPFIGPKVMILNARQIHFNASSALFPPIILLAIEDITEIMAVAETLANHTKKFESQLNDRTEKLEGHVGRLEEKISELQKVGRSPA
ncbi:MAG: nitrogen regulation protein NR(II) [Minisyncoccota bacterium]